jgi:hypothetical protein
MDSLIVEWRETSKWYIAHNNNQIGNGWKFNNPKTTRARGNQSIEFWPTVMEWASVKCKIFNFQQLCQFCIYFLAMKKIKLIHPTNEMNELWCVICFSALIRFSRSTLFFILQPPASLVCYSMKKKNVQWKWKSSLNFRNFKWVWNEERG